MVVNGNCTISSETLSWNGDLEIGKSGTRKLNENLEISTRNEGNAEHEAT